MGPRYAPKTFEQKLGYLVEEVGELLKAEELLEKRKSNNDG